MSSPVSVYHRNPMLPSINSAITWAKVKATVPQVQREILEYIRLNGPATTRMLAQKLNRFPSSLTASVLKLRESGKLAPVYRGADPDTRELVNWWGIL